ncbi:MAG TPA: TQO small subunit DoxD [Candidatus Limnocylindrales bacterium]
MSSLRRWATPLALLGAVLVLWMEIPIEEIRPETLGGDSLRSIVTVAFWILAVVVVALLFGDRKAADADVVEVEGPAFTRFLFSNTRAGLFWLPIRLFLGFSWLEAGLHKAFDENNAWLGGGGALRSYLERAASLPEEGRPPITFEWYRDFVNFLLDGNHEVWFAWVITFGEIAVGIGLLIGMLTGVAAFFGALMNMSFLLAGSASSNPVLFTFAIGLILAWRVAGYYGIDRYLLPMLGTPWRARVSTRPPSESMT